MSEYLPPWEIPSRQPRHPKTLAGIKHRAQIARVLQPLLIPGVILPTDRHIGAFLSIQNVEDHYRAVLDGLRVETELRRVTLRVVANVLE